MGITRSQKMLIFEMEGVFFKSYTKDEHNFHIQRELELIVWWRVLFFKAFLVGSIKMLLKKL